MPTNTPRRVIMRIELYPQAKDGLTDMCDRLGMTQVAATSRIIEWFTDQTDVVQAAILGLYPKDIRAEVAEMILKKMAAERKKS
ncbi:MAG: hypothetical protein M3O30_06290 [Planctomycetota bacterium]|nr:hypothetical protein [Planctomycetota bacterium]